MNDKPLAFPSRAAAKAEIATFKGWDNPRICLIYNPLHPLATKRGNIITIRVGRDDEWKFLRESGLVQ